MRICGQVFDSALLQRIQQTASAQPELSRRALARSVCQWLDWRSPNGAWQEGGCRKALATLQRRGLISLPEAKTSMPARQAQPLAVKLHAVRCALDELGGVELVVVGDHRSAEAKLWRGLMHTYHYLGDKPLCGAQLRYLIRSGRHGWLGALAFNSACWALAARDAFIGWDDEARLHNLARVLCNSRFLIRGDVEVANLASHVLGLAARRVGLDWAQRYGVEPLLLETFVDPSRFEASSYRAANWIEVGASAGRRDGIAKTVLLYPLASPWRQRLCEAPTLALGEAVRPAQPANWAQAEFATLRVHDRRLTERLCQLAQAFYNRPLANIPEAAGSKAATMAAYRLFQNDKLTMDTILLAHLEATLERVRAHPVVLAPQDTTTLNYSHHPATEGLGPVGTQQRHQLGLLLHDTVAFTPQGVPLGVLDAQCWARDPDERGNKARRHQRPLEQKESMKWLRSLRKLAEIQRLCPQTQLVSVGDREADLHELFAEALSDCANPKVLIRAERTRQRQLEHASLWQQLSAQPCAGALSLSLPKRGGRAARTVQLELRYAPVTLQPPKTKPALAPVSLWAVYVCESASAHDDGGAPIEWMLLTTAAVETADDALERTQWYAARWGIELYHRTLKSGYRIKDRQLGSATRLSNCLAIDMVVAWRLYHLSMLGRDVPAHPCTVFFEEVEMEGAVVLSPQNPAPPGATAQPG